MADRASASLADKVRLAVRAQRLDPVADSHEVQRIAREVVREHEQRSLTGSVAALTEPEVEVERLVADVSGLGPLQPLLDDPEVEEFRSYPLVMQVCRRS